DVFVRDLTVDPIELVSAHDPALPSQTPNGPSAIPLGSVSADARFIALVSDADNLVANDTNGCSDVFVRDRVLRTNLLISIDTNGVAGDFGSTDGSVSANGRYVALTSLADILFPGDANKAMNVSFGDCTILANTRIY